MSPNNLRTNKLKTDTLVDGGEEWGNGSRGSEHCWWVKERNIPSAFSTQIMAFCIQAVPGSYLGHVANSMIKGFRSILQLLHGIAVILQ
jgi:hypothetical protein